eukprot:INCI6801.2.p1 GENE.INCI6801.2~~INCI6801.2.p1  ORF type:complete len:453 (-),score=63.76 INCI6801.2:627-1985(-)
MSGKDENLADVVGPEPSTLDAPLLDAEQGIKGGQGDTVDDSSEDESEPEAPSLLGIEIWNLFKLSVPIFIMQVAWVAMNVTDSALLGHAGTAYLDAQALQSLWTSSTGVFLTGRVLIVFCSQSYGAGNKELVGVWAQVAVAALLTVGVVVCAAWAVTGPVLNVSGADPALVWPAWYYALVLMGCLPARIIAGVVNQFFQAQFILYPSMVASVVAVGLNVAFGLVFVLGIPFNPNPNFNASDVPANSTLTGGFGFLACPIVTAAMEWVQLLVLLAVFVGCCKMGHECWPANGFTCGNVFSRTAEGKSRMCLFLKMWLPAALALASDFWRVAVIGIVAETLGSDELGAFNTSYRVLWICMTFAGSIAYAVSVKLGKDLGRGQPAAAKRSTLIGMSVIFVIVLILGVLVALLPAQLAEIFSADPVIIAFFVEIRFPMAAVMVKILPVLHLVLILA